MIALAGAATLLVVACSGGDDGGGPAPRPDPSATTIPVDRSGIALDAVPGQTTTTIIETGTATITGSVSGPKGLVEGATVRIERLVAGREIRTDLLTGPDGRYLLANAPGGRYRVRAFLAPTMAQTTPEVRFLTDEREHTLDLVMQQHSGVIVRSDVAPEPPLLKGAVNLVATVLTRSVSENGIVRSTPVVGSTVELTGLGRWRLRDSESPPDSSTSTTSTSTTLGQTTSSTASTSTSAPRRSTQSPFGRTDGSGRVRFELRCETPGAPGLSLKVPITVTPAPGPNGQQEPSYVTGEAFALKLPDCIDPATTTTTTTTPPSTGAPPSSTRP